LKGFLVVCQRWDSDSTIHTRLTFYGFDCPPLGANGELPPFRFCRGFHSETAASFAEGMAMDWDGETILDANQNVCVTFLSNRNPADPLIELVEATGAASGFIAS
jgi:hypothetical protein